MRGLLLNVRWGVTYGLVFSGVLLASTVGLSIVVGSFIPAELGLTWRSATGLLATIGIAAGAVVGIMRPVAKHPVGAVFMGVIGAAAAYFIGAIWIFGWEAVTEDWGLLLLVSVVAGAPCGWYCRFKYGRA